MLVTTEALVLSTSPYSETSLIIRAYTKDFGIQSFVGKGLKARSARKNQVVRNLHYYSVVYNRSGGKDLYTLRDIRPAQIYQSIDGNYEKTGIVLFINELLQKTLKEEQPNPELYDFIKTSLSWLDLSDDYLDFHAKFMLSLTRFLGLAPVMNYCDQASRFDPAEGLFTDARQGAAVFGPDLSRRIYEFGTHLQYSDFTGKKLTNTERRELLRGLTQYFSLHVGGFNSLKSLDVLEAVFER